MNRKKLNIWDREFDIAISYSLFPGEKVTEIQSAAIQEFYEKNNPTQGSLRELERYVLSTSGNLLSDEKIDNIFKYVMPKSIFVPRTAKKTVAIICNYKFDMEHGIAVVFEEGKLKEIGTQDIIL